MSKKYQLKTIMSIEFTPRPRNLQELINIIQQIVPGGIKTGYATLSDTNDKVACMYISDGFIHNHPHAVFPFFSLETIEKLGFENIKHNDKNQREQHESQENEMYYLKTGNDISISFKNSQDFHKLDKFLIAGTYYYQEPGWQIYVDGDNEKYHFC